MAKDIWRYAKITEDCYITYNDHLERCINSKSIEEAKKIRDKLSANLGPLSKDLTVSLKVLLAKMPDENYINPEEKLLNDVSLGDSA